MQPEIFEVTTFKLEGRSCIEASAGTGKTYSIGVLVVRLLVEKDIPVTAILMVTFTRAAVAELKERIRLFVLDAYEYALLLTHDVADEDHDKLKQIVQRSWKKDAAVTIDRLKKALLQIDEAAVYTIHSFSQQMLRQFAFESKLPFGVEITNQTDEIVEMLVNEYWRNKVSTLPAADLQFIENLPLLRSDIKSAVNKTLSGKNFYPLNEEIKHASLAALGEEYRQQQLNILNELAKYRDQITGLLRNVIRATSEKALTALKINSIGDNFFIFLDNATGWEREKMMQSLPDEVIQLYQQYEIADPAALGKQKIIENAILTIVPAYYQQLFRKNLLSQDASIKQLYTAITDAEKGTELVMRIQEKFQAYFIDEFQDTDALQYGIFNALSKGQLLFLIGDPKQSIYGFRSADIETYLQAKNESGTVEKTMTVNYRSSTAFTAAMNDLFSGNGFDAFANTTDTPVAKQIRYISVTAQSDADYNVGQLTYRQVPLQHGIEINQFKNKTLLQEHQVAMIKELLVNKDYEIYKKGVYRSVQPSDIGVLVRSNREGEGIKNALSKLNIPAIQLRDKKIFHTPEAKDFLLLIEAIFLQKLGIIKLALASAFLQYTEDDLLHLDNEKMLAAFIALKNTWIEKGIYAALLQFKSLFRLEEKLLEFNEEDAVFNASGDVLLSRFSQLAELSHRIQVQRGFNPEELIAFLKRATEENVEDDEYEVRIENDEDAVNIITVHRSKGLEYNIVFAALNDKVKDKEALYTFRHPEENKYYFVEKNRVTPEIKNWYTLQQEQENRRLIYVAVTRAVYKAFLYHSAGGGVNSFTPFVQHIRNLKSAYVELNIMPPLLFNSSYYNPDAGYERKIKVASHFNLSSDIWQQISYSMMAQKLEHVRKERMLQIENAYEQFVFNELQFGAGSGNLLHYILENIDFASSASWKYHIDKGIDLYHPYHKETFSGMLEELLTHITQAVIEVGKERFSMNEIKASKCLAELAFDFPVSKLNTAKLQQLSEEVAELYVKQQFQAINGIMNGKIDLFFEYNGKYYILDWKSNYLGYRLKDYAPEVLFNAMNDNNYHLQYLIYTVAVSKYLAAKIVEFDYEQHFGGVIYVYLRGARAGTNSGIYTIRPSLEKVQQIEALLNNESM